MSGGSSANEQCFAHRPSRPFPFINPPHKNHKTWDAPPVTVPIIILLPGCMFRPYIRIPVEYVRVHSCICLIRGESRTTAIAEGSARAERFVFEVTVPSAWGRNLGFAILADVGPKGAPPKRVVPGSVRGLW